MSSEQPAEVIVESETAAEVSPPEEPDTPVNTPTEEESQSAPVDLSPLIIDDLAAAAEGSEEVKPEESKPEESKPEESKEEMAESLVKDSQYDDTTAEEQTTAPAAAVSSEPQCGLSSYIPYVGVAAAAACIGIFVMKK